MNIAPPDSPRPHKQEAGTHPMDAGQTAFFPNWEVVGCALETCNIAMWCWNIASNKITWSTNFETLHGLRRGSFDGTFSSFQQTMCSDDQHAVLTEMQKAQQSRSAYCTRYRLRPRPGNDERWIEASGAVLAQEGAPAAMIGT
jgi:PAS domain-containing protein